jgi:putative flippase GtrA
VKGLALGLTAHASVAALLETRVVRESGRYLVASATALACDLLVYVVLLQLECGPPMAGAIGYAAGMVAHFVLSAGWVFPDLDHRRRTLPTFLRFIATGLWGLALTTAAIWALTSAGLCGAFAAKVVAVGISYVAVFAMRRTYVFAVRS